MSIFKDIANTTKRITDIAKANSHASSKHTIEDLDLIEKYIDNPFATKLDLFYNDDLKPGDVIGVSRELYDHIGIYIGDNKVIHYKPLTSELDGDSIIMETHIEVFLKGNMNFFTINFNRFNEAISDVQSFAHFFESLTFIEFSKLVKSEYILYSPEETILRAKSMIGRQDYDLLFNNCEHFAMWCKTGINDCNQRMTLPFRNHFEYKR
jgi:hypothetical protein